MEAGKLFENTLQCRAKCAIQLRSHRQVRLRSKTPPSGGNQCHERTGFSGRLCNPATRHLMVQWGFQLDFQVSLWYTHVQMYIMRLFTSCFY